MQDGSALPWLILEHIPFSLADYITRHLRHNPWPEGPLATLDPADIILQLFSFTAFLHRQGAVHSDLSPHNIRLYPDTTRWVVKVIDLGTLESVHRCKVTAALFLKQTASSTSACLDTSSAVQKPGLVRVLRPSFSSFQGRSEDDVITSRCTCKKSPVTLCD
ncbi:hypothetical protein F5883DRAFT_30547 [Diaporthe sp. PMI_573]|nr:hypothetical protein F5883DRAFT_30547 [Diaporthaceae sp. PMI_573]